MALPEKKPYEQLSKYLERVLPGELEAGKSRGKATADIIAKFNEEPPREMFTPYIIPSKFGFANSATGSVAPPSWTPADFTSVQYWWTADAGVTQSGGVVSSWVDQINSFDLQQPTAGNRPTLSTQAGLNGENVISFDGVDDFLYVTSAFDQGAGNDITHLVVYYISNTTPGDGVIFGNTIISGVQGRSWIDGVGGNLRHWEAYATFGFGTGYTVESPMTTGAKSWKYRYDALAGDAFYAYNTNTESTSFSGGLTNTATNSNTVLSMGATLNSLSNPTVFNSRYIEVDIAEAVIIYGSPSSGEMDDWKTYVNNKYGTIIS